VEEPGKKLRLRLLLVMVPLKCHIQVEESLTRDGKFPNFLHYLPMFVVVLLVEYLEKKFGK
jgi:hypothetical protein